MPYNTLNDEQLDEVEKLAQEHKGEFPCYSMAYDFFYERLACWPAFTDDYIY